MFVIELDGLTDDPDAQILRQDEVLYGDGFDAIQHLVDYSFEPCWPGVSPATGQPVPAPVNGSVIGDIAEKGDSAFVFTGTGAMTYAGGGFNYSQVVNKPAYDPIPARVAADIWGDGTESQDYLISLYFKPPVASNWPISGIRPILCFTDSFEGFTTEADLLSIALTTTTGGDKNIRFVRQRTLSPALLVDQFDITMPTSGAHGNVVKLDFCKQGTSQFCRLRSASSIVFGTGLPGNTGANNTANFSGKAGRFGIPISFWQNDGLARGFRTFRLVTTNLRKTNRDPLELIDEDWDRTMARGDFS